MGKKSSSQPAAPDYTGAAEKTAEEQQRLNDEALKANRPNQSNPWGESKWSQDADGNWQQDTTLNPELQKSLESRFGQQQGRNELAEGMMGQVGESYGQPMDWAQYGDQQQLEYDPTEMRQKSEDAAYGRATSRLDPQFEQQANELQIKLANQGLSPGDQAYDAQMQNFNQSKTDAYSAAQNEAVGQGRQESAQGWQQQMQGTEYANELRRNSMREGLTQRGQPLREMDRLSQGQGVQAPSFDRFSQARPGQGTNYSGAAKDQSNFDQMREQSRQSGIGNLLGSGMLAYGMFSDRRLKRNIKCIGEFMGYPFYIFDYLWGERSVGFMSDELNPEAVSTHASGFDFIDCTKITPCEG